MGALCQYIINRGRGFWMSRRQRIVLSHSMELSFVYTLEGTARALCWLIVLDVRIESFNFTAI